MWVIIVTIWMTTFIFQNVSTEIDTEKNQYRNSRFSVGFHVLLPVAGLILFVLGRKQIFEKILLQLDKRYLRVICPRFIKKEALIKWASDRLPPTWSSYSTKTLSGGITDLWKDGSLLCTLINTGVPGACPHPHRHWKQPPVHAQALAYKYFGVAPIFSNEELKKDLTSMLDRRFLRYLSDIQQSINQASENDKDGKISDRYIVRGMGLFSGEQYKMAVFYIYLDEHFEDDNESNIIIQIKGPFGTFGEAIAPKLINKKRKRRPIKIERRQSTKLIENLQCLQSNIINFAKSTKKICVEEIDIEAVMENDRIKVSYYPRYYGMYEINMVGGGEVLKCCPFNVHIFANENSEEEMLKKKNIKSIRKIKEKTMQNYVIYEEKCMFDNKQVTKEDEVLKSNIKMDIEDSKLKEVLINDVEIKEDIKIKSSLNDDVQKMIINDLEDSENVLNEKILLKNNSIVTTNNKKEELGDKILPLKVSIDIQQINTNNSILNKQISNESNNLKSNTVITEQTNLISDGNKGMKFTFEPKYMDNVNINKIKIPERFVDVPMKSLDDKYFKNIVNESNKNTMQKICTKDDFEDDVDNVSMKYRVQMYLEKLDTSPICHEHIVSEEVDYYKKNVAEKRKIFAQSSLVSDPNSINSSFSENESSLGKKLHILKEPVDSTCWSLCSTISLPNLSLESEWSSVGSVKEKKFFWENISSRSSSSVSAKSLSPKKKKNALRDIERSKLIWSKPDGNDCSERNVKEKGIFKSADDILSITDRLVQTNVKKYQSVDESSDECTVLTIEERKKLLLKQAYEIEKATVKKNIVYKKRAVTDILKIENAPQLSTQQTVKNQLNNIRRVKSFHISPNLQKKDEIETSNNSVHHQFNTAIKYFKNLETQSQITKPKSKKPNNEINQNPPVRYRTGSLNIPSVSNKYSINNLYDDIFGNKRSFKGTPNRSAVVEALATFSRASKNPLNNSNDNEDTIQYDIFKNVKRRKRKSLNSIFDVFY